MGTQWSSTSTSGLVSPTLLVKLYRSSHVHHAALIAGDAGSAIVVWGDRMDNACEFEKKWNLSLVSGTNATHYYWAYRMPKVVKRCVPDEEILDFPLVSYWLH